MRKSLKVIFLDIDGVLFPFSKSEIDSQCMKHLKTIITSTKAKIVLSSTWREGGTHLVDESLQAHGMEPTISETPVILDWSSAVEQVRIREIQNWIEEIAPILNFSIVNWIAIDDMDLAKYDFFEIMKNHFVLVDAEQGLTETKAKEAIQLLNSK